MSEHSIQQVTSEEYAERLLRLKTDIKRGLIELDAGHSTKFDAEKIKETGRKNKLNTKEPEP